MTSQSRAARFQRRKIVKFAKIMARRFDTIHDVLRPLSLVLCLLKGQNTSILRQRGSTQMRMAGTRRLNVEICEAGHIYIYLAPS